MSGPAADAHASRVIGWSRWLPAIAYGLGLLAVVVLALTPALLLERLERSWAGFESRIIPASQLVTDLRFQYDRQASAVRGYALSRDTAYLADYRAARAAEAAAYERLTPLARQLGPEVAAELEAVRARARRERVLNDSLVAGLIPPGAFVSRLPEQERLLDATLVQTTRLQAAIARTAEERAMQVGSALARQGRFAAVLGVIAVISALAVGWFIRRQDALSVAMAQAAAQERRQREISERRREEVERITESRSRLMRGFSHDLKNPLGAADGYLQLLEEGIIGDLTPDQKDAVSKARGSVGDALRLIDDLLDLARAEAGHIEFAHEPLAVQAVAREAADEYRAKATGKGLDLEVAVAEPLPCIESDAQRIRQVIGNLLSNAVKFTDEGGVTVRVRVRSNDEAPRPGRWISVAVTDTGPGIPRDQQRYLFTEFARVATGAERRGAGIGLAISRRIARGLGGDITVDSAPGRGSTFTLWLPLATGAGVAERLAAAD